MHLGPLRVVNERVDGWVGSIDGLRWASDASPCPCLPRFRPLPAVGDFGLAASCDACKSRFARAGLTKNP